MAPEIIRRLQGLFEEASRAGAVPTRVAVSRDDSESIRDWMIVKQARMQEGDPVQPEASITFRGLPITLDQEKTEVT